ncbi:MAG: two-component sensor histidine kinase [Rhodobacterales bacterium]|nr:MAG: two-component sensor histidine kinase [Rhodobacterales bacterium]
MTFKWLKRYMPRSLYGRAALILILPIVTILLVVSVVSIQRLYEGVTRQMSQNMVRELNYVLERVQQAGDLAEAQAVSAGLQQGLALQIALPSTSPAQTRLGLVDLSGRVMQQTLYQGLSSLQAVDLVSQDHTVMLWFQTRHGLMQIGFDRLRVTARNPHQLLVLMLLTGILMTIIAIIFLRNQLRPIKRLAAAAEAFGKGHVVPYHPRGAREVRAAGAAFLAMRTRIERQIEQRTLMLSGVSHDLRTPLTRLKLGLSMMEPGDEVAELQKDVADMQNLLEGFLDFARGDAGEEVQQSDPVALVERAVANACRAGHDVRFDGVQGPAGEMMLRPVAVQRALENLIGNGVRYGNKVRVSMVFSERALVIRIEDDGPGIAREDREQALQPFSRLVPGRNQNKGSGVGLGLSIALDIARSHGGGLRLGDSEQLGGLKVELVLSR